MAPLERVATGLRILPTTAQPFAAAQAAWRFYANPRVTLPQLAQPLIDAARVAVSTDCQDYALVIHDWSDLDYWHHNSKTDRFKLSGKDHPGYELMTALVISDQSGTPIAPVSMQLRNAEGLHSSRSTRRLPAPSPLDALNPVMRYVQRQKVDFCLSARQLVRDEGEDVQDRGGGFRRDSGPGWRLSLPDR